MSNFLGSWDPGILGVLEHLGFEPPLGAVGLAAGFALKINWTGWKVPEPLVGWVSCIPGSCWSQLLLVVLEQMLCPKFLGMLEPKGEFNATPSLNQGSFSSE